jgi:hypothetical protein
MGRLAGSIEIAVGPSARDFWAKFKAQVNKNVPNVKVPVDPDLSKLRRQIQLERRRQESNPINVKVKTHLDKRSVAQTEAGLKRIEHTWKQSDVSRAIRVNLMVGGAASLPAMISGLMSLTTAVTQLSRAALALPALMSGVGAAMGTAMVGIKGVSEALKSADTAMDNSAQKMRMYQQASRDLEKAQRDIVDALKAANREIEDQQNKLTRNQLSVEQAQLNLQKANQRISKGGFDSVNDWRQAMIDQKQSVLDLNDAVTRSKRDIQDYYDSNRRGATESDNFKDALDRLSTAVENLQKRQLEAQGMSEKFIQAMKGLGPAAQDFVTHVLKLNGAWNTLKKSVSDKIFEGLGKEVTDLANKRLPMLQRAMEGIAKGLNTDIRAAFQSLGSDQNSGAISRIMAATAKSLESLKPGINSLITGFLRLSDVGSRFLPRLASAFGKVTEKFDAFISRAENDGSLEKWIDGGLRAWTSLGRALGSVLSIFGSITTAYQKATGNMSGFAGTLEKSLGGIAQRLASPEGQRAMITWINTARDFIDEIKKSLPGIRQIFSEIGDAARIFAQNAFPVFAKFGELLERHAWLVQKVFFVWATWKTIAPILSTMSKFKNSLLGGWEMHRDAVLRTRDAHLASAAAAKEELAVQQKLQAQARENLAFEQRKLAKNQIYQASAKTRNNILLQQARDEHDARKANLALAQEEAMQGRVALGVYKKNLAEMTNMGGIAGGPALQPGYTIGKDGKARNAKGRFVKVEHTDMTDAVGAEDRKTELRRERRATVRHINKLKAQKKGDATYAPGYVDPSAAAGSLEAQPGARRRKLEFDLKQARATEKAYTAALRGGLDQGVQVAWDQYQRQLKEVELQDGRVATARKEVRSAELDVIKARTGIAGQTLQANEDVRTSIDKVAAAQKTLAEVDKQYGTQTVATGGKVRQAWDATKSKLGLATTASNNMATSSGRLSEKLTGVKRILGSAQAGGVVGALGGLVQGMGFVSRAIGGVGTVGLMFALEKLAQAHQKAGERADFHRSMEEQLRNELDSTTGAVTLAGSNAQLERGQKDFSITGKGNESVKVDAVDAADRAGIPIDLLRQSLDPTQVAAVQKVQDTLDAQTLSAIRGGKDPVWNRFGKALEHNGITAEIYARALNGDTEAAEQFRKAVNRDFYGHDGEPDTSLIHGEDPGGVRMALERAMGNVPDLGTAAQGLNAAGVPSVAAGQFQRSSERENAAGGSQNAKIRQPAKAKAGGPFPGAENVFWNADGTAVGLTMNNLSPAQQSYLESLGGVTLSGTSDPGRFNIQVTGDLLKQWFEPRGMAGGGPVWGAGSATSDSIPAMLSNGEFVINAKSASMIGHDTLRQMNAVGGPTGPKLPGRFAPGGTVTVENNGGVNGGGGWFGRAWDWIKNGVNAAATPNMTPEQGSDYSAAHGIPKAKPAAGVVPWWAGGGQNVFPYPVGGSTGPYTVGTQAGSPPTRSTPPQSPLVTNAPLPGGALPHAGSGQPGPGGQRSTRGYPNGVYGSPFGGIPTIPSGPATAPSVSTPSPSNAVTRGADGYWHDSTGTIRPAPDAYPEGHPSHTVLGSTSPAAPTTPTVGTPSAATGGGGALGAAAALAGVPLLPRVSDSESGLQVKTLAVKRIVENMFPQITDIGGFREDRLKWHPNGLAVDVMIPNWDTPEGKALGDEIYGYLNAHADELGIDYMMWQEPEHYNHIHVNTVGGGYPTGNEQFTLPPSMLSGPVPPGAVLPTGTPPIATVPDYSTMTPPAGAVTPGGGSGGAAGAPGIPGITAPIPGPFGEIPLKPFDLLKEVGKALIGAFLGFFGIDSSGITSIIESIFGGMKQDGAAGDPGDVPNDNPDPTIDPGPDPNIIKQFQDAAAAARARGDNSTADELERRANEYKESRLRSSAPPSTLGSLTMDSSQGDVAKAILSEARARGYSKEEAQAILSTAMTESGGLSPRGVTPGGQWRGIFNDPKNPFAQDFAEPNINIGGFFDRLDAKRYGVDDIWKAIYWTQKWPDAAANAPVLGEQRDMNYWNSIQSPQSLAAAQKYMEQLGYRTGGHITGPGTGSSDSIPALLSNGEFVMRSAAVDHWGVDRLKSMNSLTGYAGGGPVIPFLPPLTPAAPGPIQPTPPPAPPPGTPGTPPPGPSATPPQGTNTPPVTNNPAEPAPLDPKDLSKVAPLGKEAGAALSAALTPKGGGGGVSGGSRAPTPKDPRATMGAAPTSDEHNLPALSSGIKGAWSTVGSLAAMAVQLGAAGATMGVGGAAGIGGGAAAGSTGQLIQAGAQIAGQVASGGVNILSALGVGTVTPSTTGQGYGAPMLPQQPTGITNFQSVHNGNVVTNNLSEYNRLKDRKDAQKAAPFFNRSGS